MPCFFQILVVKNRTIFSKFVKEYYYEPAHWQNNNQEQCALFESERPYVIIKKNSENSKITCDLVLFVESIVLKNVS